MRRWILAGAAVGAIAGALGAWPSAARAQCAAVEIPVGSAVGGALAPGDCTIAQLGSTRGTRASSTCTGSRSPSPAS